MREEIMEIKEEVEDLKQESIAMELLRNNFINY